MTTGDYDGDLVVDGHDFLVWQRQLGGDPSVVGRTLRLDGQQLPIVGVTAAGFHGEKEPWDAFWGQRYAQVRDPDGVPVDLFAAL